MDTSDSEITFDDKGNCCHCIEYFDITSKKTYHGDESNIRLEQIIDKIKESGKNKPYDCVMGISGGIDSCYTAFILKKYGVRVLTAHMDNGWNSDTSSVNIKYIVDKLGFDYESYVLDWEQFKNLQLAFLKASVPELETPTDIAIPAVLHKIAAKYNLKYIISGGNYVTEGILPKSWHYNAKDIKYLKSINKLFGNTKINKFPTFGWQNEFYYKVFKGIRFVYLLNLVPYSKKEAVKTLEQELNWKYYGGKHYESVYTKFVQSYILPIKFGIDYRKATFSTQICAGEITRNEALNDLQAKPYNENTIENEIDYVCKKFDISRVEFDNIMKMPPKHYYDYPNSKSKLEFIYKMYRKIMG